VMVVATVRCAIRGASEAVGAQAFDRTLQGAVVGGRRQPGEPLAQRLHRCRGIGGEQRAQDRAAKLALTAGVRPLPARRGRGRAARQAPP